MSYLNPFHEIYYQESSEFIHANTLRTTFSQKVLNAYSTFSGTRFIGMDKTHHVGLFDYATIFLPWLVDKLTIWCANNSENPGLKGALAKLVFIPAVFFTFISNVIRYVSSAVLTFLTLPIIFIVYLVANLISYGDRKRIDNLNLELKNDEFKGKLKEYMEIKGFDYDALKLDYSFDPNTNSSHINFRDNPFSIKPVRCACCEGAHILARIPIDRENVEHAQALQSLFELNVGGIALASNNHSFFKKPDVDFSKALQESENSPLKPW
ncbi:MAG: hypothetical protein H0U70_13290 [Tatlockia sp.]|nr:hypothetical protein [Tatlockia sp.]